jgi:hypothetical protein
VVTAKNAIFLDVNRVALVTTEDSEERIVSIIRETRIGELVFPRKMNRLLVTANVIPSSPILVSLSSSGALILRRATRRKIP